MFLELPSTTRRPCSEPGYEGWQCLDGQCIPAHAVCDGTPHCADDSDESFFANCTGTTSSSYLYQDM